MNSPTAQTRSVVAAVILAAGTVGCVTHPPADPQLAMAKQSLERAEQAGAPQSASTEFAAAKDKLASAEQANAKHDEPQATRLAEQANVDAQVAEATALKQHSDKAAADFDAGMQTLKQESQRSSDAQQSSETQQ